LFLDLWAVYEDSGWLLLIKETRWTKKT
jgi:hypothetical protein